ncbi:uncharacterized protein BXZ73DRAFT_74704 [Epithele typhae]|uniref:uncharacterized protein n=1 Tax=Epithele typhae TaxID=378194 RepID=UPI002007F505|nr:uncharacterized protein BXZ73DRAFT_74704 [Epithele typhae]KAH9942448.1 hypothetical protein BXZ73DRAFT_74704 [Epithele typhae]
MPPRKKLKNDSNKTVEDASEAAGTQDTTPAPRRGVRGRRGGLKDMPNMPLDILFEIFSVLHPKDLLHLSRASKAFRRLLLAPSTVPCWKEARSRQENLPAPPPHMSEPAWASLLFSNHCHGCGKTGNFTILFDRFIEVAAKRRSTTQWHVPEAKDIETQCKGLSEKKISKLLDVRSIRMRDTRKCAAVLRRWHAGEQKNKGDERIALKNERFQSYVNRLLGLNAELRGSVHSVQQWLREDGWGDALDILNDNELEALAAVREVDKPKKLDSRRGWNAIKDEVVNSLENLKRQHLRREFNIKIAPRFGVLHSALVRYRRSRWAPGAGTQLIGSFADYVIMPKLRAFLEDDSHFQDGAPCVEDVLLTLLQPLTEQWVTEVKDGLVKRALAALGDSHHSVRPDNAIELAIFVLYCPQVERHCRWEEAIIHRPCVVRNLEWVKDDYTKEAQHFLNTMNHETSNHFERAVDLTASQARYAEQLESRRAVVAASGLDPDTATVADMDACGARLYCMLCARVVEWEVLDWKAAYLRLRFATGGVSQTSMRRLHKKEDAKEGVDYVLSKRPMPAITMFHPMLSETPKCVAKVEEGLGLFAEM